MLTVAAEVLPLVRAPRGASPRWRSADLGQPSGARSRGREPDALHDEPRHPLLSLSIVEVLHLIIFLPTNRA